MHEQGAAFDRYGSAGESDQAKLSDEREKQVPWHELLLHAPLYPERDIIKRLSATEGRSPCFKPRGGHQRVGQSRQPTQMPHADEWDDDVSMGRRPERRPVITGVAFGVASSHDYSSEAAASPGRDRLRRSRSKARPNAAAQKVHAEPASNLARPLHEAPVPDLAHPLENGTHQSRDRWPDQHRPQSAPQRSAAATPRSSAATARSLVTRIKGEADALQANSAMLVPGEMLLSNVSGRLLCFNAHYVRITYRWCRLSVQVPEAHLVGAPHTFKCTSGQAPPVHSLTLPALFWHQVMMWVTWCRTPKDGQGGTLAAAAGDMGTRPIP